MSEIETAVPVRKSESTASLTPTQNIKLISYVVPIYNEGSNVKEFYRRLKQSIDSLNYRYEIIFIDDGSRDSTAANLHELHKGDPHVKFISFSRNFGHQQALSAGLDYARGDAVVSMDGDLQHPPELVPEMIQAWEEGHEIVYTRRSATEDISLLKRFTANTFYKFINVYSQVKVEPNTSDFRLVDRKVANIMCSLKERQRFYRGMIGWIGFSQKAIDFVAPPRHSGKTKFTLSKMLRLAVYGILSYSYLPLYSVIYLCTFFIAAAGLYGTYALYTKFIAGTALPGHSSILLTVLIATAVQLYAFAVIAIYVIKIFQEVKQRPIYIVKDHKGLENREKEFNC